MAAGRRVYVFIDGERTPYSKEQNETVRVAQAFASTAGIELYVSAKNLGVGNSIPMALDWAFQFEENLIVLEDDCVPSQSAFEYFDWGIDQLNEDILIVSGLAPESFHPGALNRRHSSLASFPLIWGWACKRDGWLKLRKTKFEGYSYLRVLRAILRIPKNLLPLLFFLAAAIRVKKGLLEAWDSEVVLEMLCSNFMAIIPNQSVIRNTGNDSLASHHMLGIQGESQLVVDYSELVPDKLLVEKHKVDDDLNQLIIKAIYKMELKQLLSPIKALLEKSR